MEITKKVTWTLKDGRTAECSIEVVREMVEDTVYADGWNIPNGTKPVELLNITINLDGKVVATSNTTPSIIATPGYSKAYVDKITAVGGYARVGDNGVISKEAYDKITAAMAEATAEAEQDPEYAAYKIQHDAKETARTAAEAERIVELKAVVIPQDALTAYNRYQGSEDAAWEAEDEIAWALIRGYVPAIEAQHGMHPAKLGKVWNQMTAEHNYGIKEG